MQVNDRHPDGRESRVGMRVRRLFGLTTVALAGFLAAYLVPAHLPEAAAAPPDASIDPRAARAFERNIAYTLPAGQSHFENAIDLPPGVITVIEHVSLRCSVPQGESVTARFLVDPPGPAPFVEQQIPMVQYQGLFEGLTSLVGSMETRAYATGPRIVVDVFRSDSAFSPRPEGDAVFSVAGYTTRP